MSTFNLFERCTRELLNRLAELGDETVEDDGALLLREGMPSEQLFIVINGALSAITESALATREKLDTLERGALVGEMSWLEQRPAVASIEVRKRATLLAIPLDQLNECLKHDFEFAKQFYRMIAEKLALQIKRQNILIHRFSHHSNSHDPLRKVLVLFAELEEMDVHRLAGLGQRRRLSPEDVLFRENDPVTALHIVMGGEADITVSIAGEEHSVGSSRRGELLGEMTFLLPEQSCAAATIQSRSELDLLEIDSSLLMKELRLDHKLAVRFYRGIACMLSQRSRDQLLSRQLAELSRRAEGDLDQLTISQLEGATRAARHFDWLCRHARRRQEFSQ